MKKRKIIRTGDLAPKGIKSTYQEERTNFNKTFETIWKNLK